MNKWGFFFLEKEFVIGTLQFLKYRFQLQLLPLVYMLYFNFIFRPRQKIKLPIILKILETNSPHADYKGTFFILKN